MKTKLLLILTFVLFSFVGLETNAATHQSTFSAKKSAITHNFDKLITFTPKTNLTNGLKKLYTLLLVTGIVFSLLGLLISPILVVLGLVMVVFSIILLLKN